MSKKTMTVYKIKRLSDNKYSCGGIGTNRTGRPVEPKGWNTVGKTWSNIGHLKNHLNQFRPDDIPLDWIVETYELVEEMNMSSTMRAIDIRASKKPQKPTIKKYKITIYNSHFSYSFIEMESQLDPGDFDLVKLVEQQMSPLWKIWECFVSEDRMPTDFQEVPPLRIRVESIV